MTDDEFAQIVDEMIDNSEILRDCRETGVGLPTTFKLYEIFLKSAGVFNADLGELNHGERTLRAAHRMKGGAAFIGALRLSRLAGYFETNFHLLSPGQVKSLMGILQSTCQETEKKVQAILADAGLSSQSHNR